MDPCNNRRHRHLVNTPRRIDNHNHSNTNSRLNLLRHLHNNSSLHISRTTNRRSNILSSEKVDINPTRRVRRVHQRALSVRAEAGMVVQLKERYQYLQFDEIWNPYADYNSSSNNQIANPF
jgi:hypothetical protein